MKVVTPRERSRQEAREWEDEMLRKIFGPATLQERLRYTWRYCGVEILFSALAIGLFLGVVWTHSGS